MHPEAAEGLVVVVEGDAVQLDRDWIPRAMAAYDEKYGEHHESPEPSPGVIEVVPRRVVAWETGAGSLCGTRYLFS